MHPPHKFPSLTESPSQTKPVLLIGAGMSSGIAPMPSQLAEELKAPIQHELEVKLGCSSAKTNIDPKNQESLYIWAGEMIADLTQNGKMAETDAKTKLADAIGITTDPRWRGRTKIPLRGNTPRHRVVARLAREECWHALWSLNWDCILETALESVGMPLKPRTTTTRKQPWPEWHLTWTQPEELPPVDDSSTVIIIKPHGCARKLISGECVTFKVTAEELEQGGMNQGEQVAMLHKHFSAVPLLTCGWSASEKYLLNLFNDLSQKNIIPANSLDPLSIVDIDQNNPNHIEVASSYGITPPHPAQVKVDLENCTTDELFLWIQTRFGLNQLKAIQNPPDEKFDYLLEVMTNPQCEHWLNSWFDNFLSIWVRLCFNSGITKFFVKANDLDSEAIPTDRRDEHIPWGFQFVSRPDLEIATQLLLKLAEDDIGAYWDTRRFPGGLWDPKSRHLIIPLPCLQQNYPPSLNALKSMMESHHWERIGDIMQIDILPMNKYGSIMPNEDFCKTLSHSVSNLMKHSHLADSRNIKIVELSALKEILV